MKRYMLFALLWVFTLSAYAQEQPVEKIVFQSAYGGAGNKYRQITAVYIDSSHCLRIKGKGRGKETLDAYIDAYRKDMSPGMRKANEWALAEVSRKKGRGSHKMEGYLIKWFVPDEGNYSYTITPIIPEEEEPAEPAAPETP